MTTVVSDNFNRADGDIGPNWTATTTAGQPQISSSQVTGVNTSFREARWSADSFGSDQFSETEFRSTSGTLARTFSVGIRNHGSAGADNDYHLAVDVQALTWRLRKSTDGLSADMTAPAAVTLNPGDVFRIEARGSLLSAYRNGQLLGSISDTSYMSGAPSFGIFKHTAPAELLCDNWRGGDLPPIGRSIHRTSVGVVGFGVAKR